VTVQTKDDPPRTWTVKADATGRASISGLSAGVYYVSVNSTGAFPLGVADREIVTVEAATGREDAGKWTLRVTARAPVGQGLVLDRNELDHLPSSMSAGSIIETAIPGPISSRIDGGGIGTGDPALFGSRGASWTTTSYRIGEMDVTNPARTGTPLFYPDLRMFESVGVTTGVAPVEFGQPGAAISLTPRRPGSQRHGAVEGSFTTSGLVAAGGTATAPAIASLSSFGDGAFQWSGPITSRVGAFVMFSHTQSRHFDRAGTAELIGEATSLFTNVVAKMSDRDEVRFIGSVQGVTRPYADRAQFLSSETLTEWVAFSHAQVAWDRRSSNGTRWSFGGGFSRGSYTPESPASASGGIVDVLTNGPMPMPPSDDVATSWSGRAQIEPRTMRAAGVSHSLRAGIIFGRDSSSSHQINAPSVAELDAGVIARIWQWQAAAGDSSRHATTLTAYAADRIAVSPKVTADLGLRFEHAAGSASGAPQGIAWSTVAPRASLRWTPVDAIVVTAAFGRYQSRLPLNDLAWGDPAGAWAKVYRWVLNEGALPFSPASFGPVVGRAGAGPIGTIDPELKSPHTDEYVLGVEAKVNAKTTLRGSAVIRREKDLVGQTATGVSYNVIAVPDQGVDYTSASDDRLLSTYSRVPLPTPADAFQLTNPAGASASYDGIEIEMERRGDALSMILGVMAYRSNATAGGSGFGAMQNDQGVIGNTYADPNMTTYAYGRPFFDRAYVLKWSTLYKGAHDIHAAATVRYQDGQPFSRVVLASGLSQGPELVPAFPSGLTRFTYTLTLDARVEKGFALGHSRRVAIALDLFNLTNMANEVEENPLTGASFRATTAVQPPRTARLGFKFEF